MIFPVTSTAIPANGRSSLEIPLTVTLQKSMSSVILPTVVQSFLVSIFDSCCGENYAIWRQIDKDVWVCESQGP